MEGCKCSSNGCQAHLDQNTICGETHAFEIIQHFKQLYEDKMKLIDERGSGDCVQQIKMNLQQNWIRDLTEQNEMLVKVVEQLESESTKRASLSNEKLKAAIECRCERVDCLENDVKSLIEFIRRIREEESWSIEGLQFYEVVNQDLFGSENRLASSTPLPACQALEDSANSKDESLLHELHCKEQKIAQLQHQVTLLQYEDFQVAIQQLKKGNENYESLKLSMVEMRDTLTAEVADEHDALTALRRNAQQLVDQCHQAEQQKLKKDDLIKEMRKEIKQLKNQIRAYEKKSNGNQNSSINFHQQKKILIYDEPKSKVKPNTAIIFIREESDCTLETSSSKSVNDVTSVVRQESMDSMFGEIATEDQKPVKLHKQTSTLTPNHLMR